MASSSALTPESYLASLSDERRLALSKLREVLRGNLQEGIEEVIGFGMIAYCIPLSRYPKTYNGQPLMVAALASQKNYMSLYLMSVYSHPDDLRWFEAAYKETGKRLDMGKSCIRFKKIEDLPLDVIGEAIRRATVEKMVAGYEESRKKTAKGRRAAAKKSA